MLNGTFCSLNIPLDETLDLYWENVKIYSVCLSTFLKKYYFLNFSTGLITQMVDITVEKCSMLDLKPRWLQRIDVCGKKKCEDNIEDGF